MDLSLKESMRLVRNDRMTMRWGEMDSLAHMNNVAYLRYFEESRVAWFNELEIDYEYGKKLNLGRIYTKNCSLQRLNCNIKHFLTENLYDDIDMVNSHPTIILLLGDLIDLHSPTLEEYINNRSNFLKENNLEKTTSIINIFF